MSRKYYGRFRTASYRNHIRLLASRFEGMDTEVRLAIQTATARLVAAAKESPVDLMDTESDLSFGVCIREPDDPRKVRVVRAGLWDCGQAFFWVRWCDANDFEYEDEWRIDDLAGAISFRDLLKVLRTLIDVDEAIRSKAATRQVKSEATHEQETVV